MADPKLANPKMADPVLDIRSVKSHRDTIVARYYPHPGDTRISFGDGSGWQQLQSNRWLQHRYDTPGGVRVRVNSPGGLLLAEDLVVIRAETEPQVAITVDPDHPHVIAAQAPDELDGTGIIPRYRVFWAWPDPQVFTDWWGMPGAIVRFAAASAGTHRVVVRDLGTRRDVEHSVFIDDPDLDFTVTATGTTATLTVAKATPGKDLVVRWGDGGTREPVPDNTTATHTYPSTVADTTYLVQLGYSDSSAVDTKPLTIPGGST